MRRERGTILFAVLIAIAIGAFVGTSVLLRVEVERGGGQSTRKRDQVRALAWSGVQAVMSEMGAQREALLRGERPDLSGAWVLFTDDLGRQGVVRLIDMTPEEEGLALSEQGKIDLNYATAEMIEALGIVDMETAEAIVAEREKRLFSSVEEVLRVPGVTREMVYGGGVGMQIDPLMAGLPGAEPSILDTDEPATFLRMATVFSFDPNVIAGAGDLAASRGTARLNLNTRWSPQLGRAISRVWDEDVANGVRTVMQSGRTFRRDSDIVKALRQFSVETEMWVMVLDSFCTSDDEYRLGRVDVMHAPERVLAAIPGISPEAASRIVAERESISDEDRMTTVWLLSQDVLTADEFEQAVDWIGVRSMQWRVRLECGLTLASSANASARAEDPESAELTDRIVWEGVIDVASRRPRVAYLRDLSLMESSRTLASRWQAEGALPEDERWEPEWEAEGLADEVTLDSGDAETDEGDGERRLSIADNRARRAAERASSREERLSPREERPRTERERPTSRRSASAAPEENDAGPPPEDEPPAQVDRRIGRWRGGRGGP